MAIQIKNKAALAHRLDQQTYKGEIRKDPDYYITCVVMDERKPFTITFNPVLLDKKIEKYGDRLILPNVTK
jgi:hypothetical protein